MRGFARVVVAQIIDGDIHDKLIDWPKLIHGLWPSLSGGRAVGRRRQAVGAVGPLWRLPAVPQRPVGSRMSDLSRPLQNDVAEKTAHGVFAEALFHYLATTMSSWAARGCQESSR